MPFTLAHPAAILPLRRFRFLQTIPLVLGSLVPDVPYFFPARFSRPLADTHSLYGMFVVDLPLAAALLLIIILLREPLTALLGARARYLFLRSIERFNERSGRWVIAAFSVLVGAWTHIAWDSMTHPGGWMVRRVAALSAPISLFGWDTETSHLLQYVSSVFGLAVLGIWYLLMLKRVPSRVAADPARPRARWILLALVVIGALLIGVSRALLVWRGESIYALCYLLTTRTIGWMGLLYTLAGMIASIGRRPEPQTIG